MSRLLPRDIRACWRGEAGRVRSVHYKNTPGSRRGLCVPATGNGLRRPVPGPVATCPARRSRPRTKPLRCHLPESRTLPANRASSSDDTYRASSPRPILSVTWVGHKTPGLDGHDFTLPNVAYPQFVLLDFHVNPSRLQFFQSSSLPPGDHAAVEHQVQHLVGVGRPAHRKFTLQAEVVDAGAAYQDQDSFLLEIPQRLHQV